ncbi:MAG: cell division protein FtsX [Gammaproteobacteria bacterium]|nr:cell division protein FtsX [Gammaproteobacteria bacterium]
MKRAREEADLFPAGTTGPGSDAGGDPPGSSPEPASRPRTGLRRLGLLRRCRAYGEHHLQSLLDSLGRLARNPVASAMTVAVIGIALALPTGLHVVLKNVQAVSSGWENAAQISLFLRKDLREERLRKLVSELKAMPEVAVVTYVSPDEALQEFQRMSGFGEAVNALQQNPLPGVLIVQPALAASAPAAVEGLLERLRGHPDVELAQLDMEWIKRLYAMMEIAKRGVAVLASVLALAVLLIVGNTIRLAIQNRRDEIEVQKLIGATDAFIRRPFLYSGLWHGVLGALIAWLLVNISLWVLSAPVARLSSLYDSRFQLDGLGWGSTLYLMLFGALLGYIGAWLAVDRHLRTIEPS